MSFVFKIFLPPQEVSNDTTSKSEIIERNILFTVTPPFWVFYYKLVKNANLYPHQQIFQFTDGDFIKTQN
jgi:hypothetical protein